MIPSKNTTQRAARQAENRVRLGRGPADNPCNRKGYMAIIAIANQKGGTGKTTTALNLGAGLAALGRRVLLIDLDPQSSLTHATAGDCAGASMADVLGDTAPGRRRTSEIIRAISPGLDLAPADLALSNTELGLVTRMGRENILKKILAPAAYDVILIDCAPSLALLTVNALTAADAVICPTLPTALDLRGLALFLGSLEAIRAELNPALELLGVLVCQYDNRLTLHRAALEDLRAGGLPVLPVIIGKSVQAAASAGAGEPIRTGNLAGQYKDLAEYVNQWLTNHD